MVRTVKTKSVRSLKKGETAVLLPGTTGAEPWELWILGPAAGAAECVQIYSKPLDNRLRKNSTLAFPTSEVFCLPLWLNETDTKQFAGMIPLQLELRGLQPRGTDTAVFDWSIVAQEETRTLVLIGVLPASLPEDLQIEAYTAFDLSARYLTFPENTLTIFQEQDRLVIAVTRGPHLVYYQVLTEGRITQRILQDITCARAVLSMQDIIPALHQVMLWVEVSPAELIDLQTSLKLPVKQEQRPSPRTPSPAWKLIPSSVGAARRDREVQRWRNLGLWIGFAVYLLIVALLVTRFYLISNKVDDLRKWNNSHADAVIQLHTAENAWKDLRPLVDENSYPLELLAHASASIPQDQFHLTLFEVNDDHLLIKAEAKNVAAAFQFFDKIKTDPFFSDYKLDMGNPHPLPNDLTQLQIEGTRAN